MNFLCYRLQPPTRAAVRTVRPSAAWSSSPSAQRTRRSFMLISAKQSAQVSYRELKLLIKVYAQPLSYAHDYLIIYFAPPNPWNMVAIKDTNWSTIIYVFPPRCDPCPLHGTADGDPWEDQAAPLPPAPGQAPGLWVGGAEAGGGRWGCLTFIYQIIWQ